MLTPDGSSHVRIELNYHFRPCNRNRRAQSFTLCYHVSGETQSNMLLKDMLACKQSLGLAGSVHFGRSPGAEEPMTVPGAGPMVRVLGKEIHPKEDTALPPVLSAKPLMPTKSSAELARAARLTRRPLLPPQC